MAAGTANQWWLIGFLPIGAPATYAVFQGTRAQAEAKVKLAVNGTLHGPYASRADALAAEKTLPTSIQQTPTGGEQGIGQAADLAGGWMRAISHWIGEAVSHILDTHMWRSIGWITMGIVLLVLGIFLWLLPSTGFAKAAGRAQARVS